jgi:IQ and ubiquitin-like domain-containing protein
MFFSILILNLSESIVDPQISLKELNVEENGIVQLEVFSTDAVNHPIKPYKLKEEFFNSPDVITVRVDLDQNQYKEVVVEIERSNIRKPYLGGFRHKQTGQQFFNAASQTRKPPRPDNGIEKFCRDTQTVVSHHLKMQTYNDMATQMTKPGVFVSTKFDKLLEPKTYETADEREKKIIKNVIIIQKYYRRWLAKKQFQEIQDAYIRRMEWEKEQELLRIQEIEKRRQHDINRRLNPKSKNDFEILYAALEKWRMEEVSKINATKSGAARKAALAVLLDQEAELIATIERYKIEASKENKEKQIQYLLDQVKNKLFT